MTEPLLGPAEIRALAAQVGLRPTKTLGQNFLHDANTIRRIVRTAQLDDGEHVLEVGPGLGSLTLGLLAAGHPVTAVEIDPVLAQLLPGTIADRLPGSGFTVLRADALRMSEVAGAPTALVANLPYNVAVPVLLHLLEVVPTLQRVLVMVQSEVADRLVAAPGSRTYGVPSVKAAWYAGATRAGAVPRAVFWPVPNVDSGLVRLVRRPPPDGDRRATFAVIDAAFAQRRKTLRAALAGWAGSPAAAETALRAAGIDPSARGETLGVAGFARLAAAGPASAPTPIPPIVTDDNGDIEVHASVAAAALAMEAIDVLGGAYDVFDSAGNRLVLEAGGDVVTMRRNPHAVPQAGDLANRLRSFINRVGPDRVGVPDVDVVSLDDLIHALSIFTDSDRS